MPENKEIETKIIVESLDGLIFPPDPSDILSRNIVDRYYSLPEKDKALRLRIFKDAAGRDTGMPLLTFKTDSARRQKIVFRTEIQLPISDADRMEQLLEAAFGCKRVLSIEKIRTDRQYKDFVISCDSVAKLGTFVEIEANKASTIKKVIKEMGLERKPVSNESYYSLALKFADLSGISDLRFQSVETESL